MIHKFDAIPMVPDRLSYKEMYYSTFKYPSEWTDSFSSYMEHRKDISFKIMQYMENYDKFLPTLEKQTQDLSKKFFNANNLLEEISRQSI